MPYRKRRTQFQVRRSCLDAKPQPVKMQRARAQTTLIPESNRASRTPLAKKNQIQAPLARNIAQSGLARIVIDMCLLIHAISKRFKTELVSTLIEAKWRGKPSLLRKCSFAGFAQAFGTNQSNGQALGPAFSQSRCSSRAFSQLLIYEPLSVWFGGRTACAAHPVKADRAHVMV
jgi:hypothetical protein